jgi:hypothetical protein
VTARCLPVEGLGAGVLEDRRPVAGALTRSRQLLCSDGGMGTPDEDRTRVALRREDVAFLIGCGVVLGAVLGSVLGTVTGWLVTLDWIPARGPVALVDRFATWAPLWVRALVCAAAGAGFGAFFAGQATVVEVSGRDVVIVKEGKRRRWARSQVGEAVLEGKWLSLRDHDDVDLVSEKVDGDPESLRRALARHGWPVRD